MYVYYMFVFDIFGLNIIHCQDDCKVAPKVRVRESEERTSQAVTVYTGQGGPAR